MFDYFIQGTKFTGEIKENFHHESRVQDTPWAFRAEILDCPGCPVKYGSSEAEAMRRACEGLETFVGVGRSAHQIRVDKFMRLARQRVPLKPVVLTPEERRLRARLILEEAFETIEEGLGITVREEPSNITLSVSKFRLDITLPYDPIALADGCFDLMVVTTGTLSAAGLPDLEGQRLVDENNLAKFGPGHSRDAGGKLIKPPGHKPPDLEGWYRRVIESAGMPTKEPASPAEEGSHGLESTTEVRG